MRSAGAIGDVIRMILMCARRVGDITHTTQVRRILFQRVPPNR